MSDLLIPAGLLTIALASAWIFWLALRGKSLDILLKAVFVFGALMVLAAFNSDAQQASAQVTIHCRLTQEAGFPLDPATLPPDVAEALNLTHQCQDIPEAMYLLAVQGFDVDPEGVVTASDGSRWLLVENKVVICRQSRQGAWEASAETLRPPDNTTSPPAVTLWRLG